MHTNISVLHLRLPNTWRWLIALLTVLAATLGLAATAQAAPGPCTPTQSLELWAKTGTLTLPDGGVNIWGYADSAGGAPTVPGPTLTVSEGACVQVTLHNTLGEATSLALHGQGLPADTTGAAAGGTATYTFLASQPGTFLYEAGLVGATTSGNGARQVGMGLYGALIVQPTTPPGTYNSEAVLVLSEIDPALNAAPTSFDMTEYKPRYWLINGQAYPAIPSITAPSGSTVLVRYINAGLNENSMGLLGIDQNVIAADGYALPFSHQVVAETIPPGGTMDALVSIPASAAEGTQYALYSTAQHLDNNGAAYGGQLMFVNVTPAGPQSVVVTVSDVNGPLAGQIVYPFQGSTWTGLSDTTDAAGEASFTLPAGAYLFATDDVNLVRYYSGPDATTNTCTIPGCATDTITMPVFGNVVVTVSDVNGPLAGQIVYPFQGSTWTGLSDTTDAAGEASFTLPAGAYLFATDDVNLVRYYSGPDATTNTCTIPGCATDTITMPVFGNVVVTVSDVNGPLAGQIVYPFQGSIWTGLSDTTDAAGEASFTLPAGAYLFATDDVNLVRYYSGPDATTNTCTIPGCATDTITMPVFGNVVVTVSDVNGPLAGQIVYPFQGSIWTGLSDTTDAAGEASFTLPAGAYLFATDDVNLVRYYSGPDATTNTCTIPGCATDTITMP